MSTTPVVNVVGGTNCSNDRLSEKAVNSSVRRQSLDQTVQLQIVEDSTDDMELAVRKTHRIS
jgi:hypothetical protein